VWGKSWNIPGVVAAVAERLEFFTTGGAPRRSWLRMRFLRTQMSTVDLAATRATAMPMSAVLDSSTPPVGPAAGDRIVEVAGSVDERAPEGGAAPRLDAIAQRYLGHPSWWRLIALVNDVADPLRTSVRVLRIPGAAATRETPR
jgi:hypothetical protein